jgi:hypothetical protein
MGKAGGALRNMFVWSYERGTIPYDIICALILLFIFLVPRSCFVSQNADGSRASGAEISVAAPEDGSERD